MASPQDPIADANAIEDEIAQLEAKLQAARLRLAATKPQPPPQDAELAMRIAPKVACKLDTPNSPPATSCAVKIFC